MGDTGLEPTLASPKNLDNSEFVGADSGASTAQASLPDDLASVIRAWANLPDSVRASIVLLVQATNHQ